MQKRRDTQQVVREVLESARHVFRLTSVAPSPVVQTDRSDDQRYRISISSTVGTESVSEDVHTGL